MGKKKTVFVWILLVILCLSAIYSILGIPKTLNTVKLLPSASTFILAIMSLCQIIVLLHLIYKLYNVTPDVIKWTHISFGAFVGINVISIVASLSMNKSVFNAIGISSDQVTSAIMTSSIIAIVVILLMWKGITMHLNRAKTQNLMDFS